MAVFGRYNATVALREIGETGITVALAKTFFGDTTAVHTFDLLQVLDPDALAEVITQNKPLTTQFEAVADRTARLGMHLVQVTLKLHDLPDQAENRFVERA